MTNDMRVMHNKFIKLKDKINNIILKQYSEGCPFEDLLEEDIELCNAFTDKIVKALLNKKNKKEMFSILLEGYVIYDHFKFESNENWVNSVIDQILKLQPQIQKFAKLAEEEKKKYPDEEVERLEKMNNELESYLIENKKKS